MPNQKPTPPYKEPKTKRRLQQTRHSAQMLSHSDLVNKYVAAINHIFELHEEHNRLVNELYRANIRAWEANLKLKLIQKTVKRIKKTSKP